VGNIFYLVLYRFYEYWNVFIFIFKNRYEKLFWVFFLILMSFSFVYGIFSYFYGYATIGITLMYVTYPIILFVIGYKITGHDSYIKTFRYIFIIIVFSTLFGFGSVLKTISTYGSMESAISVFGRRSALNIWTGELISATVMNMRLSFGLALLPLIILIKDKSTKYSKSIKLISFVCFITAIYSAIQLGNRTSLVISAMSMITVFLFSRKINLKKILNFFVLILVFFIGKWLYTINLFGIAYKWKTSTLGYRFQTVNTIDDPRITAWRESFYGIFENPLGGKKTNLGLDFAHNLWLDVGYEVGIIPFILLLILTILSLISLRKFLRSNHPVMLKSLIISLYTAFFITFLLEPVIQAWFTYFNLYCFILGIIQRLNFENKNRTLNTNLEQKTS
jgi:hypothetical protein